MSSRAPFGVLSILLCAAGATSPAWACSYPPAPSFDEALRSAESVAVVRLEEVRVKQKGPVGMVVFAPDLEADVHVAETVLGEPARIARLEFSAHRCGGVHLHAGEFYLLLIESNERVVTLAPGTQAILGLLGQYDPRRGSTGSRSHLFMNLRNFANIGRFPAEYPISKHLDEVMAMPHGAPTRSGE